MEKAAAGRVGWGWAVGKWGVGEGPAGRRDSPLGPSCSICLCRSEPPTVPIVTSCRRQQSTANRHRKVTKIKSRKLPGWSAARLSTSPGPVGRRVAHLPQPLHLFHHLLLHFLQAASMRRQ